MATPDELRAAANARLPQATRPQRRVATSALATRTATVNSTLTANNTNYYLGALYSTLSVKIPAALAQAIADAADDDGCSMSDVARRWLQAGATAEGYPDDLLNHPTPTGDTQ